MPPLELPSEEFSDLAHRVAIEAAAYLSTLDERPIFPDTNGARTNDAFSDPPENGRGSAVFDELAEIARLSRAGNGRFFGYVVGSGEPVAALGDLFASVLNQNVTAWRSAPAAVTVERTVIQWLAKAVGCSGFSGSLTSGGSTANLMGLAMAREAKAPANEQGAQPCIVYASEEVHMSVTKAVALLGIGLTNLRRIPVDAAFRMQTDALEAAILADERAGARPIAIVAAGGTISTGAIDPLLEISEIAESHGLWLHVDGAYGVPAALVVPDKFAYLAKADSISVDAHKWLYQPLDCGALLYRDPDVARATFAYTDDYARSLSEEPTERFAFFEESVELSRRFRALKLWLSLAYHGVGRFRAAIGENLRQAQLLADLIDAEPALERLAPVELSAVCFRWNLGPAETLNDRNAAILRAVVARGRVYLSNANLGGTFVLRACVVNHRTTDDDIRAVIDEVLTAAEELV